MGLDTTHDCWSGSYRSFNTWRTELAKAAGLPPIESMRGFGTEHGRGVKGTTDWSAYEADALVVLLNHSDCDGEIPASDCVRLADRLDELLDRMPQQWRQATVQFSVGLRAAAAEGEAVEFG